MDIVTEMSDTHNMWCKRNRFQTLQCDINASQPISGKGGMFLCFDLLQINIGSYWA